MNGQLAMPKQIVRAELDVGQLRNGAMPAGMRRAEARLIESLAEHVRLRHPDMPESAVLQEARKLYEGPSHADPLGPVGRHMRDLRRRRIMADIKAHP